MGAKVNDLSFYEAQELAHAWAANVLLSRFDAEWFSQRLLHDFGFDGGYRFLWEQPALTGDLNSACTVRNPRTGDITVVFDTHGTDLLTLCHELAHVVIPWEEPPHGYLDWDVTSMMLESVRESVG
jgi:hypothetical protein